MCDGGERREREGRVQMQGGVDGVVTGWIAGDAGKVGPREWLEVGVEGMSGR